MSKWHGGKGSKPRPIYNRDKYLDNWDKIFKKEKEPKTHYCEVEKTTITNFDGEPCNWCDNDVR